MKMEMSPTGKLGSREGYGFTLMELLVVLLILGLFASLFSIRVESVLTGGDLRLASRIVIGEISHLRGKAAYTHRDQVMEFHMDEDTLVSAPVFKENDQLPKEGTEKVRTALKEVRLPKGVDLEDVVVFQKGKIQEGNARVTFFANGSVQRALVHLRNEKNQAYTLEINPLTGQVTLYDTYIDQKAVL